MDSPSVECGCRPATIKRKILWVSTPVKLCSLQRHTEKEKESVRADKSWAGECIKSPFQRLNMNDTLCVCVFVCVQSARLSMQLCCGDRRHGQPETGSLSASTTMTPAMTRSTPRLILVCVCVCLRQKDRGKKHRESTPVHHPNTRCVKTPQTLVFCVSLHPVALNCCC